MGDLGCGVWLTQECAGTWSDNEEYGAKTQNAELCFLKTFSLFSPLLNLQFSLSSIPESVLLRKFVAFFWAFSEKCNPCGLIL